MKNLHMKKTMISSAMSVERQQKRDDFFKRIKQLMNDSADLRDRFDELLEDLLEYEEGLDDDDKPDEEDEKLHRAGIYIVLAANSTEEAFDSVDSAYYEVN